MCSFSINQLFLLLLVLTKRKKKRYLSLFVIKSNKDDSATHSSESTIAPLSGNDSTVLTKRAVRFAFEIFQQMADAYKNELFFGDLFLEQRQSHTAFGKSRRAIRCLSSLVKMTWIQRFSHSLNDFIDRHPNTVQLTLTAIAASALTTSTILTYQASNRRHRARTLKDELKQAELHSIDLSPVGTITHPPVTPSSYNEKDIQEQMLSVRKFLGDKGAQLVRNAFVIVVGAGGVGSWAALMLMRSGVKRIRIIDFDQVTLSSLNRHAVATLEDVGTPKVRAIKKHFQDIAPFVQVEDVVSLLDKDNVDDLLGGKNTKSRK